jgi:hypothetical protein
MEGKAMTKYTMTISKAGEKTIVKTVNYCEFEQLKDKCKECGYTWTLEVAK